MISGIDGCGLFAQQMPEVFVLSEHGLTIGLVMEQTLQFVGNILRRKTASDKFLDDLLIRNNIHKLRIRKDGNNVKEKIDLIKRLREEKKSSTAIILDIKGPKIRTHDFINGGVTAPKGFKASGIHCGIRKNKTKKARCVFLHRAFKILTFNCPIV